MMGESAVATETVTARDSRNQYNHFSSIHLEFGECGSCTPKTMKRGEEIAISVGAMPSMPEYAACSGFVLWIALSPRVTDTGKQDNTRVSEHPRGAWSDDGLGRGQLRSASQSVGSSDAGR